MDQKEVDKIELILATDCGSTTTKARLLRKVCGEYRARIKNQDIAPKSEELIKIIDITDLCGKVTVSMMLLREFREGTLANCSTAT